MAPTTRRRWPLKAVLWVLSVVVAAVIGYAVNESLNHTRESIRKQPYIAVVVSQKSVDFPIPSEFWDGFESAMPKDKRFVEARDGTQLNIERKEDLGSVEEAERIAKELLNDDNCVLVIGNSNSTLTSATLDIFLSSQNPPSYILPIATASDLLVKAESAGHGAVLRMVPDNTSQAGTVQRLVSSITESQLVAIAVDEENPKYSIDLSREIASKIRSSGGRVLLEETLGPSHTFPLSLEFWENKGVVPEAIVYVGVAHHGLLLIDQLAATGCSIPVIFTDGCMVSLLLSNVSKLSGNAYVLSPVANDKVPSQKPTYEPIGKDAFHLASALLADCGNWSREGVRQHIRDTKTTVSMGGESGRYQFNPYGDNDGMPFRVYDITGGGFRLLPDPQGP